MTIYDNALYLGSENNPYVVLIKAVNQDITDCQINNKTKLGENKNKCHNYTDIVIKNNMEEKK